MMMNSRGKALILLLVVISLLLNRSLAFQSPSIARQQQATCSRRTIISPMAATTTATINENGALSIQRNSRRDMLRAASACLILTLTRPKAVMAAQPVVGDSGDEDSSSDFHFQVKTTFPKGFSQEMLSPESTLVITVKPAVTYTDQVPKEVANASLATTGHWVPIVLKYQQPCSSLLCGMDTKSSRNQAATITLTNRHVTPEGSDLNWWAKLPLIVTAKLDADGADSTVGPADLVGCRILLHNDGLAKQHVTLQLQKRGICSDLFSKEQAST